MDHVVHNVAAKPPHKHGHPQDLWKHAPQQQIKDSYHKGGQAWREDQPGAIEWRLMMLPMQEEVYGDEVVVMGRGLHVKDKAVNAVLDEGPEEPAHHEEHWEQVLMDWDGEVCSDIYPARAFC